MKKIKKIRARPAKRLLAMISPAMVVVTQAGSMDMPQIKMVFHNQVIAGRSNSLPCCHHCKQFILHCQQDKM